MADILQNKNNVLEKLDVDETIKETIKELTKVQAVQQTLLDGLNKSIQTLTTQIIDSDYSLGCIKESIKEAVAKETEDVGKLNDELDHQNKKLTKLNKKLADVELVVANVKSQTVDVLNNLACTIKNYDEKIKKLTFAYNINKNAIDFHSKFYNSKLDLIESEMETIKFDNRNLHGIVSNILQNSEEQFTKIFEILADLDTDSPGKR